MRIHRRLTELLGRCLALPELCPACRGSTLAGFCRDCSAAFDRIAAPCRVCGLPDLAPQCARHPTDWRVARVWAPFEYGYPLDHYLQALKFSHDRTLGRAFGLLLAATLRDAQGGGLSADVLVPVPLHARRLRERGYNQAIEIGRSLGASLKLPVTVSGVLRHGEALAQSGLGARARKANVLRAFRAPRSFAGLRVAIVDDVVTTGATVNSLAAALSAAGAACVEAIAVARTVSRPYGTAGDSSPSGTTRYR